MAQRSLAPHRFGKRHLPYSSKSKEEERERHSFWFEKAELHNPSSHKLWFWAVVVVCDTYDII